MVFPGAAFAALAFHRMWLRQWFPAGTANLTGAYLLPRDRIPYPGMGERIVFYKQQLEFYCIHRLPSLE
jgi:hypothetical protein